MQTGGDSVVKIRCEEVWREISNYLEDEISAGLRTRMDEHFKRCKRCTAVLAGTRNIVRLAGDLAVFDLLAGFNDRVNQKFDADCPNAADHGRRMKYPNERLLRRKCLDGGV